MSNSEARRIQRGFSLTELLVVIALLGIMTVIAIPTLRSFYWGWQIKETAHKIAISVQKARLRAVNTRAAATLTFRTITSPVAGFQVELTEGSAGGASVFRREALTIDRQKSAVWIGWDDGSGSTMTTPLVMTFHPDGRVICSPVGAATNTPPRIDIFHRRYPRTVRPAYLRISPRGSVVMGNIDLAWAAVRYTAPGYYLVSAARSEELRTGVKPVTSQ